MYLPRNLISHLYNNLVKTIHPLSPAVLILVSLTPDAICACHILTALLKRAYIPHKIQPVAGYSELSKAGRDLVGPLSRQQGGDGGVVICLGVGGLVDLEEVLGLDQGEHDIIDHGVQVWVIDARRPWNLQNVFGGPAATSDKQAPDRAVMKHRGVEQGKILNSYSPGHGGVVVFDDGDIEQDLAAEAEAFFALLDIPDVEDDEDDNGSEKGSDDEDDYANGSDSRKRKSDSQDEDDELNDRDQFDRPRQRRRSNSGSAIPSSQRESSPQSLGFQTSFQTANSFAESDINEQPQVVNGSRQPSTRTLRRRLLRLRRKHEATLEAYYSLGTSYSEPISSMMYSLAGDLGLEDKESLWLAIVGVSSLDLYGTQIDTSSSARQRGDWRSHRQERIRQALRDEVRRLTPANPTESYRERELGGDSGVIPTTGKSPSDNAIRLSPEPRFLLIRHWSLYDSMLHSPYLSCRLHVWSDAGRKRLDRLLSKMGISKDEAHKGYTHMDIEIKRGLRQRLLKFAPLQGLDDLVPPADTERYDKEGWGFVRCWGWKACLSAVDVAVIIGAILEVGADASLFDSAALTPSYDRKDSARVDMRLTGSYSSRVRALPTPESSPSTNIDGDADPDWTTHRFFAAYDALGPTPSGLSKLMTHLNTAKHLHRAILRTGSALIGKHQVRHLRAFRMGVVREGPDVATFLHPGALVKLAGWVLEAVGVLEGEKGVKERGALVLGALDEGRGVYVVVGLGGGTASNQRIRSRAEQKEREARKKAREQQKAIKAAEKSRLRAERKQAKRDRDEANGIFRDEDQDDDDESEDEESLGSNDDDDDSDSDSDSDDEATRERRSKRGYGLNKFGAAFLQVVEETGARVRIDSFEHSVVEVQKEDFSGFLEALSMKSVVG